MRGSSDTALQEAESETDGFGRVGGTTAVTGNVCEE
jgi:hypothetical protein